MNRHESILALAGVMERYAPVILELAKQRFSLADDSDHGPEHWLRVYYNALDGVVRLRGQEAASLTSIMLFALLHDCERKEEGYDPLHGLRAAGFLMDLHKAEKLPFASNSQIKTACIAIEDHSHGYLDVYNHNLDLIGETTVKLCWDADRLDLPRVGIAVDPRMLLIQDNRHSKIVEECTKRAVNFEQPMKGVL
jgi:uncharacterized protein